MQKKKRNDIYEDGFIVIGINEENNSGFYTDATCMLFMEFSREVAEFLARKCRENMEHGYNLIDYIYRKRIGWNGGC